MHALVLQHVAVEGPGTLASCLEARGWTLETVALYEGARLPEDAQGYQTVIVMGGPMGVYDEAAYPFLRRRAAVSHACAGAGRATAGHLSGLPTPRESPGGTGVSQSAEGNWLVYRRPDTSLEWLIRCSPAFTSPVPVFQWHGDAFDLPVGATPLASSPLCTHQAFRYGDRVYGLLFHLELTPDVIHRWIAAFHDELVGMQGTIDPARIVAELPHRYAAYQQVGHRVFANLVEHVWEPLATRQTMMP